MFNLKKRMDQGFTLIELLVVILVIGILSGIVVLAVSNSTGDAKAKACSQNAVNLLNALDTYAATSQALGGGEGTYPTPPGGAAGSGDFSGYTAYTTAKLTSALVPNFIKKIPDTVVAYYKAGSATTSATVAVQGEGLGITGCKNAGL